MANQVNIIVNAQDKASKSLDRISDRATAMRGSFMKITAIGGVVTGALGLMTKSALDQQVGINALDNALQRLNTSYAENEKQIESTLRAIQDKTNFGDEDQRKILTTLVTLTKDYTIALQALPVVLDIAASMGRNAERVSLNVARALTGETTAVKAYGVEVDKTASPQEVLNALMETFGGSAEALADPLEQLKNELGDLQQEMGKALLPTITELLEKGTKFIKTITEWADRNKTLVEIGTKVVGVLGGLAIAFGTIGLLLPVIIGGIKLVTGALIAMALTPIGAVVAAIGLLALTFMPVLIEKMGGASVAMHKFGEMSKAIWNTLIDFADKYVQDFVKVVNTIRKGWNLLVKVFPDLGPPMDMLTFSLQKFKLHAKVAHDEFDDFTGSGAVAQVEKLNFAMLGLNEGITEQDFELQALSSSWERVTEEIEDTLRDLVRDQKFVFDAIVDQRKKRVEEELRIEQDKYNLEQQLADANSKKLVEIEKQKQIALRQAENMFETELANAIKSEHFRTGQKTFGTGNMYLGGDRSRILTSAGRQAWHEGTLQTGGRTSRHDTMANAHWVIAPELQGQITVNRVSTNLREKQGDFKSGIGNL